MSGRFTWTDSTVREALGIPASSEVSKEDLGTEFNRVSTDTRTVGEGDLFVALVGPNFDGHDFVNEAAQRGARGAVVSRSPTGTSTLRRYEVPDTLVALGTMARYRRRALPARVVGITGSAGKTSVKNLLASALSGTFRVHATEGNRNNRVGMPLTMLDAPEDAEILVLELGTNEPGEIATLTAVSEPDAAVVTTVSEAHLEGLRSLEGVIEEKLDLARGTRAGGAVVVGDHPAVLPVEARRARPDVRVAGFSREADEAFRAELRPPPDAAGRYRLRLWDRECVSPMPGRHGARNVVLALAMARLLGANLDAALREIEGVHPGALRGEVRRVGRLSLILDCYNANPQSVHAALDLLAELPDPGRRVAFLASMLELGERSPALHLGVLERALSLPLDLIVAVGDFAPAAAAIGGHGSSPAVASAATVEEGYEVLRPLLEGSETILLKGSRGTLLERLVERFEEDFGSDPTGVAERED